MIITVMSTVRTIMAMMLLHSALLADEGLAPSNGLMNNQVVGAAVTAVTPLPDSGLSAPGHKRTFVLVLGIAALAFTFQQALANRKPLL